MAAVIAGEAGDMQAHNAIDILGQRFGQWMVVGQQGRYQRMTGRKSSGELLWLCECSCGNRSVLRSSTMLSGRSTRCVECYRKTMGTHRMTHTPAYSAWKNMIGRCRNKTNPIYGGRGISVCERWKSFLMFLADMGDPPEGKTLDRIDTNGNYCPENCRWATPKEQSNNRRDNIFFDYQGERFTLTQLAETTGINRNTLDYRLKHWSPDNALSVTPSHCNSRRFSHE